MAKRVCAVCGKDKNVEGGKTCENEHFVCKDSVYDGVIFISQRAHCPLDKKPLRKTFARWRTAASPMRENAFTILRKRPKINHMKLCEKRAEKGPHKRSTRALRGLPEAEVAGI